MSALRTFAVGTVFIALIAAACGGGDSDAEESGTTDAPASTTAAPAAPQTTATADTTEAPQPDEPAPGGSEAPAESTATVTIDGVSYEFGDNGPAATCDPSFFGGFFAVLFSPDLGGSFSVELWKEGTGDGEQVSGATMNVEADGVTLDLEADPEMSWPAAGAGTSYVGDFNYDGNRAEGTIYFINSEVAYDASLAPLDPIVAEFEVVCADA